MYLTVSCDAMEKVSSHLLNAREQILLFFVWNRNSCFAVADWRQKVHHNRSSIYFMVWIYESMKMIFIENSSHRKFDCLWLNLKTNSENRIMNHQNIRSSSHYEYEIILMCSYHFVFYFIVCALCCTAMATTVRMRSVEKKLRKNKEQKENKFTCIVRWWQSTGKWISLLWYAAHMPSPFNVDISSEHIQPSSLFVPHVLSYPISIMQSSAQPAHEKYVLPLRGLPFAWCRLDRAAAFPFTIDLWLVGKWINAMAYLTNENPMGGWLNRAINLCDQQNERTQTQIPTLYNAHTWKCHIVTCSSIGRTCIYTARRRFSFNQHEAGTTTTTIRIHSIPFAHKLKHNKIQKHTHT